MPKSDEHSSLGSPKFRQVFGDITRLMQSFEVLDQAVQRSVTPDDEIGYTIGLFLRGVIAKKDPERIKAILAGFERGMKRNDNDISTDD